jgi:hypothetical protein
MMMVFASDTGIELLRRATTISVDGTFSSVPAPFIQLFILMASLPKGGSTPAAFGLLPNKNTQTYSHFFTIIKGLAEDMFQGIFKTNISQTFTHPEPFKCISGSGSAPATDPH